MGALADAIEQHVGPWTVEEFAELGQLPPWPRIELIEGTLVVSPHAVVAHQRACMRLSHVLAPPAYAVGMEVFSPANVAIPAMGSMPIPDIVVATTDDAHGLALPAEEVTLVVEVESPSTRGHDRLRKADLYARAGIAHYWRVELPDDDVVVVRYRLDGGRYEEIGREHPGDQMLISDPFEMRFDPATLIRARR